MVGCRIRARAIVAGVALAWVTAATAPRASAGDDPDPRRAVVVLEFRAGSAAVADVGGRIAAILRARTSLDVIDGDDARKRYGADLDKRVARCAGQAECIAELGGAVEAREVLLIGISEFGDVIMTFQRIDVDSGRVAGRVAEALAAGAEPDDDALQRYVQRVMPKSDFLRFGMINIVANVTGATVKVADKPRGTTPIEPLRVRAPATYRIEVSKDGYVPFRASVDVPPDATVQVEPTLSLRGGDAWYKKWWVAAIAGTVVAGAVTIAVVATRDDPTEVPLVIDTFESPAALRF